MITQDNFDWSLTKKRFVLFVPNYGRKNLFIHSLKNFYTDVGKEAWQIVVVNDGIHEDFSDLNNPNISYFTFLLCKSIIWFVITCKQLWGWRVEREGVIMHALAIKKGRKHIIRFIFLPAQ